ALQPHWGSAFLGAPIAGYTYDLMRSRTREAIHSLSARFIIVLHAWVHEWYRNGAARVGHFTERSHHCEGGSHEKERTKGSDFGPARVPIAPVRVRVRVRAFSLPLNPEHEHDEHHGGRRSSEGSARSAEAPDRFDELAADDPGRPDGDSDR